MCDLLCLRGSWHFLHAHPQIDSVVVGIVCLCLGCLRKGCKFKTTNFYCFVSYRRQIVMCTKMGYLFGSLVLLLSITSYCKSSLFESDSCYSFGSGNVFPGGAKKIEHKLQFTKAMSKLSFNNF